MLRINQFRLWMAAACLSLSLLPASAQSIAIVDTQAAILATAEIAQAQQKMEADFKPRQDELQKLQQELQAIQEQLQKMAGKLTPQAERDLQLEGQRKQREFQRMTEDLETDINNRRNDILTRVGRQMREVIQKLAEQKGYDAVFDIANALYVKPSLNITKEATEAYDAAYPVK